MSNYLSIVERGRSGPAMSKDDWDFHVIENVRSLVEKYHLAWNQDQILSTDEDLIDRIYHAGLELILNIGVYALSQGRIIRLTEQEIRDGIHRMNKSLKMGEGKDACVLKPRTVPDSSVPKIWAGNPGVPTPERLFKASVKSWAKEPLVDLITCGSLVDVDGFGVETGGPAEVLASRRELTYLRQVREEVGRPGLGMLAAESAVSEIGDLAATHPDLLRPCDSHLVAMFNELMIDNGNMVRAANSLHYGMANASLATVMVGGLAGDAPGAAVVQVASFLAANVVCLADYHLCHPIHIHYVATSTRGCMWLQSSVCRAFARNAPAVIVCDIYPKSGALTPEVLYEVAANTIAVTLSGGHLEGVGSADGAAPNGTGLEVRMMAEVAHAVTGQNLTLDEGNRMILRLLEKYEMVFHKDGGNPGVSIDEAYNLVSLEPVPEWQRMYEDVRSELIDLGLKLN